MKILCLTLAALVFLTPAAAAQSKQTENTLRLDEGQTGAKATINEMKWLAGTWRGAALGGYAEEIYSEPKDGVMMGVYRLVKDGKPVFYEILLVREENSSLAIRLKHFTADLVGWEEKEQSVGFRYIKRDAKRIYFEGMTFEPIGADRLNVYLAIRQKDGSVREEVFRYRRAQ